MGLKFWGKKQREDREVLLRMLDIAQQMAESARLQSEAAIRLTERMIPQAEGEPETWNNTEEIPFMPLIGKKHERRDHESAN
jgi:hypothetical protein